MPPPKALPAFLVDSVPERLRRLPWQWSVVPASWSTTLPPGRQLATLASTPSARWPSCRSRPNAGTSTCSPHLIAWRPRPSTSPRPHAASAASRDRATCAAQGRAVPAPASWGMTAAWLHSGPRSNPKTPGTVSCDASGLTPSWQQALDQQTNAVVTSALSINSNGDHHGPRTHTN